MIDCTHCQKHLMEYLLGTLDLDQHAEITAHLATCDDCTVALGEVDAQLAVLDVLPEFEPPRDLTESTVRHLTRPWRGMLPSLPTLAAVATLLFLAGLLILPVAPGPAREAARRASSQNNLRQMGMVFKMYANESRGELLPPLAPGVPYLAPDLNTIFPEYLSDSNALIVPEGQTKPEELRKAIEYYKVNPGPANRLVYENYVYPGYVLPDAVALEYLLSHLDEARATWPEPLERTGAPPLHPLREGVERFYITDINNPIAAAIAQSEIIVMFENPAMDLHRPDGVNVLYLDGHVEFVRINELFPGADLKRLFTPPPP